MQKDLQMQFGGVPKKGFNRLIHQGSLWGPRIFDDELPYKNKKGYYVEPDPDAFLCFLFSIVFYKELGGKKHCSIKNVSNSTAFPILSENEYEQNSEKY